MSLLLRAAALVLAAATLGACASDESGTVGTASMLTPAPSQSPQDPTPDPAPDGGSDAVAKDACDEVAAGIGAFNAGDLEQTVASFERAVPLAEAEDAEADTRESADLLEAVRYYADLAPQDYPEASVSSPDFARYKAITLGQCLSGLPSAPDDGGGIAA